MEVFVHPPNRHLPLRRIPAPARLIPVRIRLDLPVPQNNTAAPRLRHERPQNPLVHLHLLHLVRPRARPPLIRLAIHDAAALALRADFRNQNLLVPVAAARAPPVQLPRLLRPEFVRQPLVRAPAVRLPGGEVEEDEVGGDGDDVDRVPEADLLVALWVGKNNREKMLVNAQSHL